MTRVINEAEDKLAILVRTNRLDQTNLHLPLPALVFHREDTIRDSPYPRIPMSWNFFCETRRLCVTNALFKLWTNALGSGVTFWEWDISAESKDRPYRFDFMPSVHTYRPGGYAPSPLFVHLPEWSLKALESHFLVSAAKPELPPEPEPKCIILCDYQRVEIGEYKPIDVPSYADNPQRRPPADLLHCDIRLYEWRTGKLIGARHVSAEPPEKIERLAGYSGDSVSDWERLNKRLLAVYDEMAGEHVATVSPYIIRRFH